MRSRCIRLLGRRKSDQNVKHIYPLRDARENDPDGESANSIWPFGVGMYFSRRIGCGRIQEPPRWKL